MKILPNENGKADKSLLLISSLSNPKRYKKEVFSIYIYHSIIDIYKQGPC